MGSSQDLVYESRAPQATQEAFRQRTNLKQSIFKHLFGTRGATKTRAVKHRAAAAAEVQDGEVSKISSFERRSLVRRESRDCLHCVRARFGKELPYQHG